MDEAYNFVILDLESSNVLAYPDTWDEAEATFLAMIDDQPSRANATAVVGLDKDGFPVATMGAADLPHDSRIAL